MPNPTFKFQQVRSMKNVNLNFVSCLVDERYKAPDCNGISLLFSDGLRACGACREFLRRNEITNHVVVTPQVGSWHSVG